MNILSLLSAMLATAFLIGGIYCFTRNRKTNLNLFSLLVLLALGWWSFCSAFFASATTQAAAWHWHRLSSLGWTGFIAVTAHYFIVLTGHEEKMKKPWVQLAYYALPAILLLHNLFGKTTSLAVDLVRTEGGGYWTYLNTLGNVWLWLYFVILIAYFGLAFFLLIRWARNVRHPSKKRMAFFFIALDALTILVGFVTDVLCPLTNRGIPPVANLASGIFAAGYFFIIIRYDVFNIRNFVKDREIIEHSMEALMVTDESGEILDANTACAELLETNRSKLIGSMSNAYFSDETCSALYAQLYDTGAITALDLPYRPENGREKQLLVSGSVIRNRQREYMGTVFSLRDITQLNLLKDQYRRKSEEYEQLAYVDPLTGLPNRRKTFAYLVQCAEQYVQTGRDFFVLYLDLNDFKSVNDQYGHDIGDHYLRSAAQRMTQCLHDELQFLGRIGGDEFLVVGFAMGVKPVDAYQERLYRAFSDPFTYQDVHILGGISLGYALYSEHSGVDDMLRHADKQMYVMKNEGHDPKVRSYGRTHSKTGGGDRGDSQGAPGDDAEPHR